MLLQSNSIVTDCNICEPNLFVYGICSDSLVNGQFSDFNNSYICVQPLIFNGSQCTCQEQFILNGSVCVNLNQQLTTLIANDIALQNQININSDILNKNIDDVNRNLSNQIIMSQIQSDVQFNQSEHHILGNSSMLSEYLNANMSILDQRIFDNYTQLNSTLGTNIEKLQQQLNIINQQIEIQYVFVCSQDQHIFKLFNISEITQNINSNQFSQGHAFGQQMFIQNAFINIQSIGQSFTIFQSQQQYTNIKIQLEQIQFLTGSILTDVNKLSISMVSIISKEGTKITVNQNQQLSLLQINSIESIISHLSLNLSCDTFSSGSIYLIKNMKGTLNIQSYQVFGSYFSSNSIALISYYVLLSQVSVKYLVFDLVNFTTGNCSSYLIFNTVTSKIRIQSMQLLQQYLNQYNIISTISSSSTNQFQFGGVVTSSTDSQININDITLSLNDIWKTQFVYSSGQLIGEIIGNYSSTSIKQLCFRYSLDSQGTNFSQFGSIGQIEGKFVMNQANIQYQTIQGIFNEFAIIGITNTQSWVQLYNFDIQLIMNDNAGLNVSALVGYQMALNWSIYEIYINNSQIFGVRTGLITGQACNNGSIFNIQIEFSQAQSNGTIYHAYSGAITGFVLPQAQILYYYITIVSTNINIFSQLEWNSHAGGIIGEINIQSYINITNSQIKSVSVVTKANVSVVFSGGLVGKVFQQLSIKNSQIINSNLSSTQLKVGYSSGFIGYVQMGCQPIIYLINSTCQNVNLVINANQSATVGGMVGEMVQAQFQANNVTISNINFIIVAPQINAKITFNYFQSSISILNSSTYGTNILNNNIIQNCVLLTNIDSQNGC
ncbi:Hypothetical_protein [Hexamita inflata]|uniref:Hypothetical_protein n=1 Tax=Hexamita inflata TaxID=28002 RepID=A0AA86THK1_9EUKA|nr:Hypothetical protein HINF_LOCUS5445 [Hexamita inflata]